MIYFNRIPSFSYHVGTCWRKPFTVSENDFTDYILIQDPELHSDKCKLANTRWDPRACRNLKGGI